MFYPIIINNELGLLMIAFGSILFWSLIRRFVDWLDPSKEEMVKIPKYYADKIKFKFKED